MRTLLGAHRWFAQGAQPLLRPALMSCPVTRPMASAAATASKKKKKKNPGNNDINSVLENLPSLTPTFDPKSNAPIDDYQREGKRTPQQLLVESIVAKNYSRLKMTENKRRHAELNRRIKLREAAIAALPQELRAEAQAPDTEDFPVWRQIAGEEIVVTFEDRPEAAEEDA
eukprot:COSAG02_NODE_5090_length_4641_cov_4.838397_4_plen_171_part_00